MPLRILVTAYQFSPHPEPGSYKLWPSLAWNLVDQVSQSYDVSVLTHSRNHEKVLNALSTGELPRVSVHFIDPPSWQRRLSETGEFSAEVFAGWEKSACRAALALHEETAFDAVHHLTPCHGSLNPQLGSALSLPTVWGPVCAHRSPTGSTHIQRNRPKGFLSAGLAWGKSQAGIYRRRRNRSLEAARAILAGDPTVVGDFPHSTKKKIRYFAAGGVTLSSVKPVSAVSPTDERFHILSAGDFRHPEGYRLILRALHIFQKENKTAKLTMMGSTVTDPGIQKLKTDLGVPDSGLAFQEWQPLDKLAENMGQCDVFVFPDFDAETAALSVLALAQGVPVLAFEGSGADVFIQSSWGHIIPWRNPGQVIADLVSGFRWLDSDPGMRRRMGRAAVRMVKKSFTWEPQAALLESIYGETLLQNESIHRGAPGEGRLFY
jgi:glycosyltransferase involved in cell wall biosynthesis